MLAAQIGSFCLQVQSNGWSESALRVTTISHEWQLITNCPL
jgi:hypothetical protein